MSLKFGVAMLGDAPLAAVGARARLVEELGYGHLWVADERLMRNVYVCLTVAALNTERIGLGTAVTNPYTRSPALTAAAIATIDELAGGRVILGLGAGGGLGQYGIDRARPVVALREAVRIVRGLTAGERLSFQGHLFSTDEAELGFRAVRRCPIYLAARGPRILELAGELADGVIIGGFALPSGQAFARSCVETGLRSSGRTWADLEAISWLYVCVDDDPEVARRAVEGLVFTSLITSRPILDRIQVVLPVALREHLERTGWSLAPQAVAAGKQLLSGDILDAFSVTGTAAQCARKLSEVARSRIDQIAMVPLCPDGVTYERMARRLAEEVL